jgi:hypothetical protein
MMGELMLELQPIDQREAFSFIAQYHRHHKPPQGWKFGIAVNDGKQVVGVVTIGRPVARMLDDGWTLEVTRCCTDGTRNVESGQGPRIQTTYHLHADRRTWHNVESGRMESPVPNGWRQLGHAFTAAG